MLSFKEMKFLLTYADEKQKPLLDLVKPHYQDYAERHGYHFLAPEAVEDTSRTPHWQKIKLMQNYLPECKELLWLDCDLVICQPHLDVAADAYAQDFQTLAVEHTRYGLSPNTGLWLLRNNAEAREFLEAVWQRGDLSGTLMHDQATVADLLGFSYPPSYAKPVRGSPWLRHTGWLHPFWNMLYIEHHQALQAARAIHYGGMPMNFKLHLIAQELFNRRLPGWEALPYREAFYWSNSAGEPVPQHYPHVDEIREGARGCA